MVMLYTLFSDLSVILEDVLCFVLYIVEVLIAIVTCFIVILVLHGRIYVSYILCVVSLCFISSGLCGLYCVFVF